MGARHLPLHSRAQAAYRLAVPQLMRVLPAMASNEQQDGAHRSTYASFTSFTKWGSIVVIVILLALYVFLV
jgi:hypothetical protein